MSKRIMWIIFLVLLGAWFLWQRQAVHPIANKPAKAVEKAFLSAEWGMGPEQVAAANHGALNPVNTYRRFYTPKYEADKSRYQALEQDGLDFLGREASAIYTFFDGKLFGYHVFVTDRDPVLMDKDFQAYLHSRFGEETSLVEDNSPLKLIWDKTDEVVNYWFYKDTVSVSQKYTAGFGVINRKLKQALGA